MRKRVLFLVVLFLNHNLIPSERQKLFCCFRRNSCIQPAAVEAANIPYANEPIIKSEEVVALVDHYIDSNVEMQSLLRRGSFFPCRESSDHNHTCACRNSDGGVDGEIGVITMDQLIYKSILKNPSIMRFEVDMDEQGYEHQGVEEGDQLYGASKSSPFVLFRMERIVERYADVLEQEKRILIKEKKNQKQCKQELHKLRELFVKKGVVAVMCRCECKLHKSCFDKMVRDGISQCMRCQENITPLLGEIACNFVYPDRSDDVREESCPKCRKALWKFNK